MVCLSHSMRSASFLRSSNSLLREVRFSSVFFKAYWEFGFYRSMCTNGRHGNSFVLILAVRADQTVCFFIYHTCRTNICSVFTVHFVTSFLCLKIWLTLYPRLYIKINNLSTPLEVCLFRASFLTY